MAWVGDLIAFADDIMDRVKSHRELKELLDVFRVIEAYYGLTLYREKIVFLSESITFKDMS
jgi:hypothetical protein